MYAGCVETGGKCIVCVCMCVLLLSKKKCKMIGRKYVLLLSKLRCIYAPVFEDQRNTYVCVCVGGGVKMSIYIYMCIFIYVDRKHAVTGVANTQAKKLIFIQN